MEKKRKVTVSISSEVEIELNQVKKERYAKSSKNEMFKDLIIQGLQNINTGNVSEMKTVSKMHK